MLESFNTKSELQYQRLTEEEKQKRGILGRLVGIIADFKNATRNGRCYTEELWDKTFDDPIVKEKIENRCILGELGHPVDRQETDIEKVAICLAEMPKKGNDGKLHGIFDILDTPNGRILNTLCNYGCNIGVSSRGGGDTYEDYSGKETVDPDTYEFECFDAVLLPAVKAARPTYVTESFDTSKKTLRTALLEQLNSSSEEDRKVMQSTLENLNINYSTDEEPSDSVEDKVEPTENTTASDDNKEVTDDGVDDIVVELQEALKRQQELEDTIRTLQEKLSVCYTKETRYSDRLGKANAQIALMEQKSNELSEEITTLRDTNAQLTENKKQLETTMCSLQENINNKERQIKDLTESLEGYRSRYMSMKTKINNQNSVQTSLNESISQKSNELATLKEEFASFQSASKQKLTEALEKLEQADSNNKQLIEQLQDAKKDTQIIKSQSNAKLEKAQQLVEKYKSVAKTAVDKYIVSQATKIGVSAKDIKSRLNESYSFKDIDKVVEDLQQYKVNVQSLPFTTMSEKKITKARITESFEPIVDKTSYNFDDDVDESLLTFTN